MRRVRLSGSSRSVIALLTAAMLLLCQMSAAAQACAHTFTVADAAATPPCHESMVGQASRPGLPETASICDASKAVSEVPPSPVASITDWPALPVEYFEPSSPKNASLVSSVVNAVCFSPPPLTVLHCKLLN